MDNNILPTTTRPVKRRRKIFDRASQVRLNKLAEDLMDAGYFYNRACEDRGLLDTPPPGFVDPEKDREEETTLQLLEEEARVKPPVPSARHVRAPL